MRVKLNKDSFPHKRSYYEYTLDGKVYAFQPHQILHVRYPDPNQQLDLYQNLIQLADLAPVLRRRLLRG
jgi:hypothetical protein